MKDILLIWAQFALCVAWIGWGGMRLIRYGDAIAAQTGLSRGWIGLILVATVTSLPELVTGLSAVTLAASPNMAVGDALGSCVFNLAILACVDVFYRKQSVYLVVSRSHILSAGFGVVLLSAVALLLVLSAQGVLPATGHVSWGSVVLIALYALAMRALYAVEQRRTAEPASVVPTLSLRAALSRYAMAAILVVVGGVWLPMIGVKLAQAMGWSDSFVGTLFVALATSVPELATTWAAVRLGAIDMAVGNLLGSNLFDVLILAIDDMAFQPGSLYAAVSPIHVLSALSACLMSGAVVVALAYRQGARVCHIGSWASIVLLALYLLNAVAQFQLGH